MKKLLLFCVLCGMTSPALAFDPGKVYPWTIRANAHYGLLLPEYGFMNYIADDYIRGAEVNLLHQTTGSNIWQQLYRYPAWGVSFFYSSMGSASQFGDQYTIYPYYRLHIAGRRKVNLSYQMGVGLSYATKKYNPENNFVNVAIATHLNIHYHADLLLNIKLSERMGANAGLAFNHISNANLGEPNVGLNFATAYAGLTYSFGEPQAFRRDSIPAFTPEMNYHVMVTGGIKHTRTFESFKYPAFSVSFNASRRTGHKFAFGVGADFFYDTSVEDQMVRQEREFKSQYAYMTGIHFTQEFIYNKFSLLVQEGFYIGLRDELNNYFMYNRAMVRWHITPALFVNASMKSHLYILDFPEIGVGYTFR
ncbi:MAG: acyloxyacyl hydrolase [Bacteroidia bacterium]|jgi:hypothetical protein|nr:acyloxyacyl hydrolase [Bacteroidia bacterium]